MRALRGVRPVEHLALYGERDATNTKDNPDNVVPRSMPVPELADGRLRVTLPAMSWNLVRLSSDVRD